jgi:hypothetical protein
VGPLRRRRGKLAAAALMSSLVLLGVFVAGGVMPYAGADDRQYEEFYTPPDPLPPGQPGDLIRTEPSRLALEPPVSWAPMSGPEPGSCTAAPMLRATRSR